MDQYTLVPGEVIRKRTKLQEKESMPVAIRFETSVSILGIEGGWDCGTGHNTYE